MGDVERIEGVVAKDPALQHFSAIPIVREELKAALYGAAAASGVVQGVTHAIMTEDKLTELKPGEILVAPGTAAPWAPAFGIVSGVVTHGGPCPGPCYNRGSGVWHSLCWQALRRQLRRSRTGMRVNAMAQTGQFTS
jgi:hypothetical protein